jgi:hypothetical protein
VNKQSQLGRRAIERNALRRHYEHEPACETKPIGVSRPELQVLGRYLGSEDSCETNPIPGLRQPGDEELPCETKPIRGPGSRLSNTLAGWHRPTCMGPHTQHFACGSPLTVLFRVGQSIRSPTGKRVCPCHPSQAPECYHKRDGMEPSQFCRRQAWVRSPGRESGATRCAIPNRQVRRNRMSLI